MLRRTLSLAAIIVTSLLLQSTVFSQIRLAGAKPELVYLVVVLIAYFEGPSEGAIVGFAGGMVQDFMLNQPKGITALTLILLGYGIGLARQYISSPSPLLPTMLVAIGTFAGVIFHEIVRFLLSAGDIDAFFLLKTALLSSLYGAILTPLVFPVIRRVSKGSRLRRVVRF